jgi:hypothetical protein
MQPKHSNCVCQVDSRVLFNGPTVSAREQAKDSRPFAIPRAEGLVVFYLLPFYLGLDMLRRKNRLSLY